MKKIFKYRLPIDSKTITITANVIKWLDIQEQDGWPVIWAVIDEDNTVYPPSEYEIVAWGTGWEFPDELNHCRYMGTAQDGYGDVWHYFMQEKSKSFATEPLDYWNGWLSTTPAVIQDYNVTISCGDSDSAVSALNSSIVNIDNLVNKISDTLATSSVTEIHSCAHT